MGEKLSSNERDFVIETIAKNSPYCSGIIIGLGINLYTDEDIISLSSTTETPVVITRANIFNPRERSRNDSQLDRLVSGYFGNSQTMDYTSLPLIRATKEGVLGGCGVTARTIESTEEIMPGIQDRLDMERGKIVFPGNGLSNVPLIISGKYDERIVKAPPVIVDILDYQLLEQELSRVKSELDTAGLGYLLTEHLDKLGALNGAHRAGKLLTVNYFFGKEAVPKELTNANLVVNCMGPPLTSISEQLFLLAPNGELYSTEFAKMIGRVLQLGDDQTHFALAYGQESRQFTMKQTYRRGECGLDSPATTIIRRVS